MNMNRKIKFRAYINGRQMINIISIKWIKGQDYFLCKYHPILKDFIDEVQIKKKDLLQYTGLHDSKGKEIYEGDILKMFDRDIQEVKWDRFTDTDDRGMAYGFCFDNSCDEHNLEVIGNIYENPELLTPPVK